MRRVCILALPQVFDSALTITRDVLATGRKAAAAEYQVELTTVGGRPVHTAGGLRVAPQGALRSAEDADLVLVPGFSLPEGESEEAVLEYLAKPTSRSTMGWLRRVRRRGGAVASGCTATFLLAEAGLLDGLQATTSWWLADDFRRRYPSVDLQAHMMVTHQEGITCAGAALAHTDLALRVLSEIGGPAAADHVARHLLLDERISQGRYMASDHLSRRHPEVLRAEAWVRANIGQPLRVADLAAAVAVSPRTLARRCQESLGLSPLGFIQKLRIEHAIHLLESTDLPIEHIADRVGYHEPAGLRRVFLRETGRAPSTFRRPTGETASG
ncbi:MAG: helix-turn-helix domain-containing protein [Acidobacteriota bacterium]